MTFEIEPGISFAETPRARGREMPEGPFSPAGTRKRGWRPQPVARTRGHYGRIHPGATAADSDRQEGSKRLTVAVVALTRKGLAVIEHAAIRSGRLNEGYDEPLRRP
jgi:hypothetical protein